MDIGQSTFSFFVYVLVQDKALLLLFSSPAFEWQNETLVPRRLTQACQQKSKYRGTFHLYVQCKTSFKITNVLLGVSNLCGDF